MSRRALAPFFLPTHDAPSWLRAPLRRRCRAVAAPPRSPSREMALVAATMHDPARLVAYMLEKGSVASVAAACFSRMVALAPDPSEESIAHLRTFVEAGGVQEMVRLMREHADVLDGRALNTEVLALADVQEQGCILLMNLAGLALSGDAACAAALRDAKAAAAVVRVMTMYSEQLEKVEGAAAALMQLATLDLHGCMEAGLAQAVVGLGLG